MTRECPHCSAPLEEDDAVCPSCGQSVAPAEVETVKSAPESGGGGVAEAAAVTALEEGAVAPAEPPVAPQEAPEREIRFDSQDDLHFEPEPFPLDEAAPAPGARYVVFRCARCQMPMAPGTTACLRCGLQRAQPVPRIAIHASPQTPFLRQGEYHCPECQAVLAPQSNLCTNCGAEFVSAVPPVSWGTPGASATGGNAALWTRPPAHTGPETWKIVAAVIAVVAFAAVLLMIGALSAGQKTPETVVTTTQNDGTTARVAAAPTPALPPVVMAPGSGGAAGQVHASPVGTWVKGSDTMRLDEIGGAWVDAPDITGSKSKVNLNWTLVDTTTGQSVRVQGPGYTWDFAWNFGADGSETLTQNQWGELRKLPDGSKPAAPKPAGAPGTPVAPKSGGAT